jgi:hypothetical protein
MLGGLYLLTELILDISGWSFVSDSPIEMIVESISNLKLLTQASLSIGRSTLSINMRGISVAIKGKENDSIGNALLHCMRMGSSSNEVTIDTGSWVCVSERAIKVMSESLSYLRKLTKAKSIYRICGFSR